MKALVKKYPKISALLGTLAVAGAGYYGVPPGVTQGVLAALFGG